MGLCLTGLWTRSTSLWLLVHLVLRTRYILDIQDMIFYMSYFGKGLFREVRLACLMLYAYVVLPNFSGYVVNSMGTTVMCIEYSTCTYMYMCHFYALFRVTLLECWTFSGLRCSRITHLSSFASITPTSSCNSTSTSTSLNWSRSVDQSVCMCVCVCYWEVTNTIHNLFIHVYVHVYTSVHPYMIVSVQ